MRGFLAFLGVNVARSTAYSYVHKAGTKLPTKSEAAAEVVREIGPISARLAGLLNAMAEAGGNQALNKLVSEGLPDPRGSELDARDILQAGFVELGEGWGIARRERGGKLGRRRRV
ncbi:MAG: hypothetical protein JSR82_23890 [Verrucomicrobia bacterium]|nr:hypothetical protein [Verrucomicrobiota bacterium]